MKKSCVRTILDARVIADPPCLHVDLVGTGFLYNMVRIVVGTLIEIGQGKRQIDAIATLLEQGARKEAGFTVPPTGLCLMEVHYDGAFTAF